MFCTKCGAKNRDNVKFCTACGTDIVTNIKNVNMPTNEDYYQKMVDIQSKQLKLQENQIKNMAKCPKCGSTSLSGNKKGFGIGKAVVGGYVVGPIGLVAGNLGAKKVHITCLNCGKKFKI